MEEFITNCISQYGFPVAICFYLLARVVKAIDRNTTTIEALRKDIKILLALYHQNK